MADRAGLRKTRFDVFSVLALCARIVSFHSTPKTPCGVLSNTGSHPASVATIKMAHEGPFLLWRTGRPPNFHLLSFLNIARNALAAP
jgi:hypothetical protein